MSIEHCHSELADSSTDELLRSVQDGDMGSWNSLDRRYRARLTRLLHGRIPGDMRARFSTEDVVQSTLFVAFEKISQYKQQKEDGFRLWLNQILRNRLRTRIRFHRAQRRDASAEIGTLVDKLDGGGSPNGLHSPIGDVAQALEGLSRLPERDQEFLRMRFFGRASFSEIGRSMGVSEATARRKISSLLIVLRDKS